MSLEEKLVNRRDPTAARFMLPLIGDISIGDVDMNRTVTAASFARLPNSLVQDKSQAANLHRAVRISGMPALTTLLQIATDPAQIIWPSEVYADIDMETVGRLGSKTFARLDLAFGITNPYASDAMKPREQFCCWQRLGFSASISTLPSLVTGAGI